MQSLVGSRSDVQHLYMQLDPADLCQFERKGEGYDMT